MKVTLITIARLKQKGPNIACLQMCKDVMSLPEQATSESTAVVHTYAAGEATWFDCSIKDSLDSERCRCATLDVLKMQVLGAADGCDMPARLST